MNYPILPDLTPDGTVYFHEKLGTVEALLPPGTWSHAQVPALLETSGGDVLCTWFASRPEESLDAGIVYARLPKGGIKWLEPQRITHNGTQSKQTSSLFQSPNGSIRLLYATQCLSPENAGVPYTCICERQSHDEGRTWENSEVLFQDKGSFYQQPLQILSNGRWLLFRHSCAGSTSNQSDDAVLQISEDAGKNWRFVGIPDCQGCTHIHIVELSQGHMVAFLCKRGVDWILRSESADGGNTWTVPSPTLLSNNTTDISVLRLHSNRLAVAYSPAPAPQSGGIGLCCTMAVALSEDSGKTFPLIRCLEFGEGYLGEENLTNNQQCECPCLMQAKDRTIHLAFSYKNRKGIKWLCFTEEDILGVNRKHTV